MKKKVILVLTTFLALVLSSCGGSTKSSSVDNSSKPIDATNSEPSSNSTSAPSSSASSSSQQSSSNTSSPSSSESSSSSISSSSSEEPKTDWTAEEKNFMRTLLHGVELPFVEMPVHMESNGEYVRIKSYDAMEPGFLSSYASKFASDSSWEGGDVSSEMGQPVGTVYSFIKPAFENGQKYYISVIFCGGNHDYDTDIIDYNPEGTFLLLARDPYFYSYPTQSVSDMLSTRFGSTILPPEFAAEYYSIDDDGIDYWVNGYNESNIEESYKAAVEATHNFTVKANRDAGGFYVASSNDDKYVLRFKYIESEKIMCIVVSEYKGWSASVIAAFFAKYNVAPYAVPSIDEEGIVFSTSESSIPGYEQLDINITNVTTDMVQSYVYALQDLGYHMTDSFVDDSEIQWYSQAEILTSEGFYRISLTYATETTPKTLMISLSLHLDTSKVKDWPAEQVATAAQASNDTVPAYTDDNRGFFFNTSENTVYVYLYQGAEYMCSAYYVRALKAASYTENGTHGIYRRYISPNHEISVLVGYDSNNEPGMFKVVIQPIKVVAWPTDTIATKLGAHDISLDALPPLAVDASNIDIAENGDDYDVRIACKVGFMDLDAAYESYEATLQSNHFTYSDDSHLWTSPCGEYTVKLDDNGSDTLYIKVTAKYDVWPSLYIDTILSDWGITNDVLPELVASQSVPKARDITLEPVIDGESIYYRITCKYLTSDGASLANNAYRDVLSGLGYTMKYHALGYAYRITSNEELAVRINTFSDSETGYSYFYIMFYPYVPSNGYQEVMEALQASLPDPLVAPNLEISDAKQYESETYYYQGYTNIGTRIYVTFPEGTNVSSKLAELKESLEAQGYTFSKMRDYGGYLKILEGQLNAVFVKPYVTGNRICIEVHREDVSVTGYGIYILTYSESGSIWSYDYKVAHYDEDIKKYCFDNQIELTTNMYISGYDFNNETAFHIEIDDQSFGGNLDEYLEYDDEKDEYRVLQDFTAYFYLNIEYGNDTLFISFTEQTVGEGSWEAALQVIKGKMGEEYVVPNLNFDGVVSFVAETDEDGAIVQLVFDEEETSYDDIYAQVAPLFKALGYREFDGEFWNYKVSVRFYPGGEGIFELYFEESLLSTYGYSNYGFLTSDLDGAEGVRTEDAPDGYSAQYKLTNVYFAAGTCFFFINFDTAQELNGDIIENKGVYLRYDAEKKCYYVYADFTADIYIKTKYGADSVWLSIYPEE